MTDVIDFQQKKDEREIAPCCRLVMPDGSTWYKFTCEYEFDGKQGWNIEFFARDVRDAERRVQAIRDSLVYVGQLFDEQYL